MAFAQDYKQNLLTQANKSKDPSAAADLYILMSNLSRNIWKAIWLNGCEELFWSWVHDPSCTALDPEERIALQELSEKAGGWWCWGDTDYPTFMSTKVWEGYLWN